MDQSTIALLSVIVGPTLTFAIGIMTLRKQRVEANATMQKQRAEASDLDASATQKIQSAAAGLVDEYKERCDDLAQELDDVRAQLKELTDKYKTLEREHLLALTTIQNQNLEISRLRARVAELEAQLFSPRYPNSEAST